MLAGLWLLSACARDEVQLTLAPPLSSDSSAQDVAASVETIQVVVSSPQGLQGVTAAGKRGDGYAVDWNGDGKLEVVFTAAHAKGRDLPTLEIGVGADRDRRLEFRVIGFDVAIDPDDPPVPFPRPIAYGGSALAAGTEVKTLGVLFDLRAEERPPQVVLTLPPDDLTSNVPGNLAAVTVVFSTTVVEQTAIDEVHLIGPLGEVTTTKTLDEVTILKGDPLEEKRSVLTMALTGLLSDGDYAITVGSGLTSTKGFKADPFTSHFHVQLMASCPPTGCVCQDSQCGQGLHCNESGGCVFDVGCGAQCPDGKVCDPLVPQCVEDCHTGGSALCPKVGTSCGADGLCQ